MNFLLQSKQNPLHFFPRERILSLSLTIKEHFFTMNVKHDLLSIALAEHEARAFEHAD